MRAVNLVPAEARPGKVSPGKSGGAAYGVIGLLAVLLIGMILLSTSKRDQKSAEQSLVAVQQSTQQYQAVANQYSSFESAAQQAAQRISVVRSLADARFDWAGAMRELSRLIPADTQVSSLDASVKSGASVGSGSSLRGQLDTPAISITACSKTQTSVAKLLTNLQAMRRVTNVTLESSDVSTEDIPGTVSPNDVSNSSSGGDGESADSGSDACSLPDPYFDVKLTVFFAQGDAKASDDVAPAPSAGGTTISSESPGGTVAPASTTPTSSSN